MKRFSVLAVLGCVFAWLVLFPTAAYAVGQEGDYTYTIVNGKASIQAYTGSDTSVVIPSTLGGMTVSAIEPYAFQYHDNLEAVVIPASVATVSDTSFKGCNSLSSIVIDDANPYLKMMDGGLYEKNGDWWGLRFVLPTKQGTFHIPANAYLSTDSVFGECHELTSFSVEAGNPYYWVTDNLLYTREENDAAAVALVACPAGLAGDVSVAAGTEEIGQYAFDGCNKVTTIHFPQSIAAIGNNFGTLTGLRELYFAGNAPEFDGDSLEAWSDDFVICAPDGSQGFGEYWLGQRVCYYYDDQFIFNGLGYHVLTENDSYGTVELTSKIARKEADGFTSCQYSGDIVVPNTFKYLGITYTVTGTNHYALQGDLIQTVDLPSTMVSIDLNAFYGSALSLTGINVDGNNPAYESIDGILFSKDGTVLLKYPAARSGTSYVAPASVTHVARYALQDCDGLTSIVLPSVTTLSSGSIMSCDSLTFLSIPSLITTDQLAIHFNSALRSITIPASTTFLGSATFLNCKNLTSVYFEGNAPLLDPNHLEGLIEFEQCPSNLTLYYLAGATGFDGVDYAVYNKAVYASYAMNVEGGSGSGVYPQGFELTISAAIPDGMVFDHWTTSDGGVFGDEGSANTSFTMPDNATTVTAHFLSVYHVTFHPRGGSTVADQSIVQGALVSQPVNPTRAEYIFSGWYCEEALVNPWNFDTDMVTDNLDLWAKWVPVSYSINYILNGGIVSPANPTSYSIESEPFTLNNPTKAGYTFMGWSGTGIIGTAMNVTIPNGSTGNRAYTANWSINSYTATFDSQGGSMVANQSIVFQGLASEPAGPTRTGYTFAGWYKEPACTTSWDFDNDRITDDTMLYAKWSINSYTVNFDSQGGSAVTNQSITYQDLVPKPATPTKTGYTFTGWYKDAAGLSPWDFANDRITAATTLYAKWTINSYTVIFNCQGGSAIPSQTKEYNSLLTEPTSPTKTGHTFIGWFKDAALSSQWNFATDKVTTDTTLFAKWSVNSYTVDFHSQNGDATISYTLDYNSIIPKPGDPVRTGYTFGGWYTDADCQTAWNFSTDRLKEDISLWAKWTINDYTITFNSQGGSAVPSQTKAYNSLLIRPDDPTRTGYTFDGWYTEASCVNLWNFPADRVTDNTKLYAGWTIGSFQVNFNSQGGSAVASQTVAYRDYVARPANPTRSGYTFGGWYFEAACISPWNFSTDIVTGNMTLFAKWTVNTYTVAFNSQGGSAVANKTVAYNGLVSKPADPTRSGYTFGGWYRQAACTTAWNFTTDNVTANTTIYAKWTINSYTVTFNSQGGSAVANKTVAYNGLVSKPADPTRTGYTFGGWYRQAACTTAWNFITDHVTANTTIYAKWTINSYTVTFNSQGGSAFANKTVAYNGLVPKPADPTRSGYTFGGWYKQAACTTAWNFATDKVTGNTTIYAKWTAAVKYTISASPNSTNYGSVTGAGGYTSGTAVILKAIPKAGYRFVRWLEGTSVVSTGAEYKFTVSKARLLKAEFAKIGTLAIKAAAAGYNSIKLSWPAVTGSSGYEVYRVTSSSGNYTKLTTTTSTTYTSSGLTTGTTYYYKVRVKCVAGSVTTYGSYSAVVPAKPVPATPTVKVTSTSYSSVKLTWAAVSGASGYELYRAASSSGAYSKVTTITSGSTVTYTNSSLTSGTTYYYKVRAYRLVGSTKVYGNYSSTIPAKPVPATPTGVKAVRVSSTSVKVSWYSVAGAGGYEVYNATASGGTYSLAKSTTTLNWTNTGLTTGKTYYYKLRAYRLEGSTKVYGNFSGVVSAKP